MFLLGKLRSLACSSPPIPQSGDETAMSAKVVEKRLFNPEQANAALPLVRRIVADIVEKSSSVRERRQLLNRVRRKNENQRRGDQVYSDELDQIELELDRSLAVLQRYVEELERLGVEVHDVTVGMVDFPAMIDGREARLCWKLGESEVTHWHPVHTETGDRRSLLSASDVDSGDSAGHAHF
jgi:hypothetical protein